MSPCLATTGSSIWMYVALSLGFVVTGVAILSQRPRLAVSAMVMLFALSAVGGGTHPNIASATCNGDVGLLSGTFRATLAQINSTELPTITATDGTSTLTAQWGAVAYDGSDSTATYAFPTITAGSWTIEVVESTTHSMEYDSSSVPFTVNSSPMLTGGPLDAVSTSPVVVGTNHVTVDFSVTVAG